MGRNITVYELDFQQIKSSFCKNWTNSAKEQWSNRNENKKSITAIEFLIENEPEKIEAETWIDLIYNISEDALNYTSWVKLIKKCGIKIIFSTSATNPSCVFMELYFEHFEDKAQNYHALKPDLWNEFIEKISTLNSYFLVQEHPEYYDYLQYCWYEQYLEWAKNIYDLEKKRKTEDPEHYSRKWGTDYFAFAESYVTFNSSFSKNSDLIVILDSY